VRRLVEDPLSEALLDGFAVKGDSFTVDDCLEDEGGGAAVNLRRGSDGVVRRVPVEGSSGGIEAGEAEMDEEEEMGSDAVGAALSPQVAAMRSK